MSRRTSVKSRRTLLVAWLLAAFVWAAAPATGQEVEIPEVFSETIDVRVVNVEVVVTDRQGNRVQGLKPSDFELLVDGKPTPIDYFTEIEDGLALGARNGDMAAVPSVDPDAPVGTNFLVFIDDLFSIKRDRNRVLDRLRDDLRTLRPVDRVAVVAFDGKSAETLTGWTPRSLELEEALDRARERPTRGMKQLTARSLADTDRQVRADVEAVQPEGSRSLASLFSRAQHSYRERLNNQLESSVLAAMATMRQFSRQPGRKVMLLLAGGWPRSVAIYTRANLPDGGLPRDRRIMSEDELYGPLVSTANLIGFSLYPVDVPGPVRSFGGDASTGVRANGAVDPAGALTGALEREDTVHSTLHLLARSTGGVPLVNFRRDVALASVAADTRSYYWLGFEPQRREDNRFHQIVVRLAGRADLNARAREGYVDMSRDHELDMTAKAALLFGDPPDALPLEVHFSKPVRAGRRKMSVNVEVAIPLDEIQLLPVAGEWLSVVEIRVTAMDEGGNRSEVSFEKVPITGSQEPQPGQVFYYETDLQLRRREHSYVITVHDPLTGTNLTSTGKVGPKSI
ncbi:MAG: VWA domain-containing protein [Holophagales bacterium]|nr:VWA domain-containing protein [Holophagales bacterium]MYG31410.1 VWA domain-containing protein [Holophagales bacterium]MYI81343.1 VWA domain-containing protein [Holophagales bacterium]